MGMESSVAQASVRDERNAVRKGIVVYTQCSCGRKIAMTSQSVGRTVECPNCREPRTLVVSSAFGGTGESRGPLAHFETLGACMMWMVAILAVAAVLLVSHS